MRIGYFCLTALALLSLSNCAQRLKEGCECGFFTTTGGKIVRWPKGSQVDFLFSESVPLELRDSIKVSTEHMNQYVKDVTVRVEMRSNSSAPKIKSSKDDVVRDGTNGIYWLEDWPWKNVKGKENTDAMTVLINKGDKIVEADIFLRAESYKKDHTDSVDMAHSYHVRNSTNSALFDDLYRLEDSTDKKWIVIIFMHEMGHALGMSHLDDRDSLMYPSVSLSRFKEPLSEGDRDRILQVYGNK